MLLLVHKHLRVGLAEAVDALLDVADEEEVVPLRSGQRKINGVLQGVGVLVLVYQNGGVAVADGAAQRRAPVVGCQQQVERQMFKIRVVQQFFFALGGKAGIGKLLRHPHQRGYQRRGAAAVGGIFLTRTQQKIGAQAFDLLFGAGAQLTGRKGAGIAVLAALDAPGAPPGGVKLAQCGNGLVPIAFFQHLAQPGHAVGILLQYGGVGKVGSFVLGGGAGRSLQ